VYNNKCVINQKKCAFFVGQGHFVRKNLPSFIFRDGQSVPKIETFCRKFARENFFPRTALSQGPFCPRDVSLQNFWDKKSMDVLFGDVSSGYPLLESI
jgi:hypothetical protein